MLYIFINLFFFKNNENKNLLVSKTLTQSLNLLHLRLSHHHIRNINPLPTHQNHMSFFSSSVSYQLIFLSCWDQELHHIIPQFTLCSSNWKILLGWKVVLKLVLSSNTDQELNLVSFLIEKVNHHPTFQVLLLISLIFCFFLLFLSSFFLDLSQYQIIPPFYSLWVSF